MREQAKITSKGQITIPRNIRKALGVQPGDSVVFDQAGDEIRVRPVRKESAFAKYRGIGNPGIASGREAILSYIDELRGREKTPK